MVTQYYSTFESEKTQSMAFRLQTFWLGGMTTNAFSVKAGINEDTVNRWVKDLPQLPLSYLKLCAVLSCTPQQLIDRQFTSLCNTKGLLASEVAYLCGFNPFTFVREIDGDQYPIATALLQLDKIYKYCNGFEMAFDVDAVKADVIDRVNRIANAIAA